MPNTKSAERRMRNSARRATRNRQVKGRLKTLGAGLETLLKDGKKEEAMAQYREVCSALDKAAKRGVIHWGNADRKKSRLASRLAVVS